MLDRLPIPVFVFRASMSAVAGLEQTTSSLYIAVQEIVRVLPSNEYVDSDSANFTM